MVNLHEALQTSDSGFVATGWYMQPGGTQVICLIRTDSNGNTLWTKTFGESEDVIAISMDITSDNGYIISGSTYINPPDSAKIYVIRTNSNGDTLWTKKYGGIGNQDSRCVLETLDGGFIISGETSSYGAGSADMYIIKTDSVGNVEWSRTFGTPNNDYCYSILQTADSGYVALGTLKALTINSDIVLVRLNSQGDSLWTRCYGDLGGTGIRQEIGFKIIQNLDRGFAIGGYTNTFGSGSGEVYCIVTDSLGNLLWSKTYGSYDTDWGYSILQKADSNYVLCGNTSGFGISTTASYIIETDVNGNVIWSRTYEDTYGSVPFSIYQTYDGGYITAGEENELMKLNAEGSSGCLEQQVATLTTNPPTSLLNIPIFESQPATPMYATQTIIGSGINIINVCTSVNIEESSPGNNLIQLFQNPAHDYFTIQLNDPVDKVQLIIYNFIGELIYRSELNDNSNRINCSQFGAGIYLVKMLDDEKSYTRKLIIEHN